MSDKIPFDFDEYIRQSEPDKQQKGYIWQTAIGLQDVDGVYKFAGMIRDYNISKKEWILKGKSLVYAGADTIKDTLNYDFDLEKSFDYSAHRREPETYHRIYRKYVADSSLWRG